MSAIRTQNASVLRKRILDAAQDHTPLEWEDAQWLVEIVEECARLREQIGIKPELPDVPPMKPPGIQEIRSGSDAIRILALHGQVEITIEVGGERQ